MIFETELWDTIQSPYVMNVNTSAQTEGASDLSFSFDGSCTLRETKFQLFYAHWSLQKTLDKRMIGARRAELRYSTKYDPFLQSVLDVCHKRHKKMELLDLDNDDSLKDRIMKISPMRSY